MNKKGVVPVKDCTVILAPNPEKPFTFILTHPTFNPVYLRADNEQLMKIWMGAIEKSAKGLAGPSHINVDEYYSLLGLDSNPPPGPSEIKKSYRKMALASHPDKGGSADAFNKLTDAYNILLTKAEEDEELKNLVDIEYEAIVTKGGPGIGFGLVVSEDPKTKFVLIKELMPTMQLVSISDSSGGSLSVHDRLVGVENDDTSEWPIARVVQRLSDFRIQVNSNVRLVFRRKVPQNIVENQENNYSGRPGDPQYDEYDTSKFSPSLYDNEQVNFGAEIENSGWADESQGPGSGKALTPEYL